MANGENINSPEQVAEKGQKIYDEKLKPELEKNHQGEFVVIDVDSGEYVVANSLIEALQTAKEKYPGKVFHSVRIGFPGIFRMGTYAHRGYFYGWANP